VCGELREVGTQSVMSGQIVDCSHTMRIKGVPEIALTRSFATVLIYKPHRVPLAIPGGCEPKAFLVALWALIGSGALVLGP
jgi:hypothetical protein